MEIKKENIGWIDLLRIIACLLVLISHSCDPFVAQFDNDKSTFLTGVFTGSFVRPCVPLFVMMTGVLLLPVKINIKEFYKKRILRIITALAFWSIVLPFLYFIYLNYIHTSTHNLGIVKDDHTLKATLAKFYTFIFNFNFDTTPLWYLYMLVGLYLVMPILSAWLQQATRADIKLVLTVWMVTLLLPYIKMLAPLAGYPGNYGNQGILGVCDWNEFGTFYYVSGFTGYLILAYYLVKFPLHWSWMRTLSITIPVFAAGYLITSFGYVFTQKYFPGNYAYLEIIWYFSGINVCMMTVPVFIIVQKIKMPSSVVLSRVASMTFGIYLCHFIFIQIAYDVFYTLHLPVLVNIIAIAVSAFSISYVVARVMNYSRLTRRFIK